MSRFTKRKTIINNNELYDVIAWFNKAPTESHVKIGSVVSIPKPIQRVLKYLRNN